MFLRISGLPLQINDPFGSIPREPFKKGLFLVENPEKPGTIRMLDICLRRLVYFYGKFMEKTCLKAL